MPWDYDVVAVAQKMFSRADRPGGDRTWTVSKLKIIQMQHYYDAMARRLDFGELSSEFGIQSWTISKKRIVMIRPGCSYLSSVRIRTARSLNSSQLHREDLQRWASGREAEPSHQLCAALPTVTICVIYPAVLNWSTCFESVLVGPVDS